MNKQSTMPKLTAPASAIEVPLNLLTIDETNARHDSPPDADIPLLAASIRHVGLLQPLVVIARGDVFGVIAGRRRLLALQMAFEDRPDILISCHEIHADDAAEASLAENYARKHMSTRELYHAFKAMGQVAKDEIAEAFGMDEKRVARILRLANLADPIMTAWDEGRINESQAQAYAMTADKDIQLSVWERVGEAGHYWSPSSIRSEIRALISGNINQRLIHYVGEEAYIAAGGAFEKDLFSDELIIKDPMLLSKLADDKLEADKACCEASLSRADSDQLNLQWVTERPPYDWQLRVEFEEYYETEADALRVAEIDSYLDNYNQELDELEFSDVDLDQQGQFLPGALKYFEDNGIDKNRILELVKLRQALIEEQAALVAKIRFRIPKDKGAVIAFGFINGDGFGVEFQYADYDAAGIKPPTSTGSSKTKLTSDAPKTQAGKDKEDTGSSRHAFLAMQVIKADTIALEAETMAANGDSAGLDMLLFILARSILSVEYNRGSNPAYAGLPAIREAGRGLSETIKQHGSVHGPAHGRLLEMNWMQEKDIAIAWDLYLAWVKSNRAELGAALLGIYWQPLANEYFESNSPVVVELLGEMVDPGPIEWAARFDREALLDMMSHKARLKVLHDFGLGSLANGLKKATSTAMVVNVLGADSDTDKLRGVDTETRAKINAWLPPTVQLHPVKRPELPKAKKKTKAKPKKKTDA